jgi:hypothetical protein
MKKTLIILAMGIFMGLSSSSVWAQKVTRITFARGASSAVVTGSLKGYRDSKTYLIRVRKGQKMTTENIGSHHITLDITAPAGSTYEPDLAADCHDRHTVEPTAKGDYRIRVTECRKADAFRGRFTFRVRVR